MCRNFSLLSRIDQHRFIVCCEHGNIHLQWGKIRFTFTYQEFVHLLNVLETTQHHVPDGPEEDNRLKGNGQSFRANIDTAILRLSLDDLSSLVMAMYTALRLLEEEGNPAEYTLRAQRQRTIASLHGLQCLFSNN